MTMPCCKRLLARRMFAVYATLAWKNLPFELETTNSTERLNVCFKQHIITILKTLQCIFNLLVWGTLLSHTFNLPVGGRHTAITDIQSTCREGGTLLSQTFNLPVGGRYTAITDIQSACRREVHSGRLNVCDSSVPPSLQADWMSVIAVYLPPTGRLNVCDSSVPPSYR